MTNDNLLTVFCGPMFASKSSSLIAVARDEKLKGNKIAGFKPVIDNRYIAEDITTHDGLSFKKVTGETVNLVSNTSIFYLIEGYEQAPDAIFIDEVQFFPNIVPDIISLNNLGIRVYCAGLDMDSFGDTFGPMGDILARATEVVKCTASCSYCGEKATMTFRKLSSNREKIAVGGAELYEPRCLKHWLQGEREKLEFANSPHSTV